MNAAFDKQFTQALQLVVSRYQEAIHKVALNPEKAQSTRHVITSLMDSMVEKGLISDYLLGDEFNITRSDYRKGPRSPYPANPNYLSIPRIADTLGAFLKEQNRLTGDTDDSWFRQNERQLTRDIAQSFKFTGLIQDYTLAGDKVGVVAQKPEFFLTDQQLAKFKAHTRDDSPSP
ncbi:hypothetical protein IFT48_03105 [Pseudomonas fluorescens]|uniref:hypothetical protein n=1 Tax=Pseudomonas TaxID=286 RepID=UPI000F039330|nr:MULTISPECIES: hypothetical protein [Pseudomonas]MBD8088956.1 hypothetical protein [Pseudomonas fluorescens]MBD8615609.1 hypothetical protein [Pseudomonas putida]MBD8681739.1 hypothetical protein [Pseudomonas sp. CFBP 13719]